MLRHPVGATGLRMLYEIYKQLQGKCGSRQVKNTEMGLAHTWVVCPATHV